MSERPTAQELTEAILEFLGAEILPTIDDQRLRFRTLVAMNALSIVYRELERMPAEDDTEQRQLAARIRAGDVPPGTLERVKGTSRNGYASRRRGTSRRISGRSRQCGATRRARGRRTTRTSGGRGP